jgi:hypothetical protein
VQNYGYMPVSLLSRENRVAYIKREFTVYNKKVSLGWSREGTVMMQGSFVGGVKSH